ncbi:DUF3857 domain-containing protein [Taibaiella koreensis]|uniref:DUF3857 domain-containing protein n=1 Tax=Taibaiella koreensis TaxID=1268548 RepID=UPI000E59D628|nr:DUF3857 domain-containing protein [Taibaiella koreensis]
MRVSYCLITFLALLTAFRGLAGGNNIVENEQTLRQYLEQTVFPVDTGAQAIVLYEKGSAELYEGNLTYRVEKTIKILGKDAIGDLSEVVLPYGGHGYVRRISGTTYNLEDGKIVKQSIERDDMLKDKIDKNTKLTKFSLPSVKVGSIIHYSYIKEQPGFLYVPDWYFQEKYPKLYSTFSMSIPRYIIYDALLRVNVAMHATEKESALDTCSACFMDDPTTQANVRTWVRRDVPAFREEPYMSSEQNYLERIKIHVSSVRLGGITYNVLKDWPSFSTEAFIKSEGSCGQAFARNGFLEDKVTELTKGTTDELAKAQALYSYVRNHYTRVSGGTFSTDIKKVFEEQKSNQPGINLLLTAFLRKAGLNSVPVILSTRDQERLNMLFPNPDPVNCLVSMVTIGKRQYFLDASYRFLPFGMLLPECYNGYCRTITEAGGSGVELEPDSLLNKTVFMVSLMPSEKDKQKLRLKLQEQLGIVTSASYRSSWQKDSTKLKENILNSFNKGTMSIETVTCTFKNMDRPDERLLIEFETQVNLRDAGTLYFDPYFIKFQEKNPFTAATRHYMIEREYREDINYVLNFQLPEGYELDDYPKSSVFKFNNPEQIVMKNLMAYDEQGRRFSLNSRLSSNTTLFPADDYNDLRTFYEKVMELQQQKIVLKKKD